VAAILAAQRKKRVTVLPLSPASPKDIDDSLLYTCYWWLPSCICRCTLHLWVEGRSATWKLGSSKRSIRPFKYGITLSYHPRWLKAFSCSNAHNAHTHTWAFVSLFAHSSYLCVLPYSAVPSSPLGCTPGTLYASPRTSLPATTE
jgi:hypothetical protein